MMNLSSPNQKTPMPMNTIISNMKSPQNNSQMPPMPIMSNPQLNLPERKSSNMNINSMNTLQNIPPNINQNQNIPNYTNPMNYTNIPNQNMIPNLPPNKAMLPQNYLNQIQMQNLLNNMTSINQIVPGATGPSYPNIPAQIPNMGLNPINPVMSNPNLNNSQFNLNMNGQNMNTQMTQNNVPQNLSRMESGNLNNNNNFENKQSQQQQNDNEQKMLLLKLEKALNNINNSSAKDPRKNKKK